jgi:hypothetical protein
LPFAIAWNGKDDKGFPVPPGVYFAESPDGRRVKMVKIE